MASQRMLRASALNALTCSPEQLLGLRIRPKQVLDILVPVLEDLIAKRIPHGELVQKISTAIMLLSSWDKPKTPEEAILEQDVNSAMLILRDYQPKGLSIRVTEVDGAKCIITRDYKPLRINVSVRSGLIRQVFNRG